MWVGPYEVLSELGRGSFGIVYKALAPSAAEVAVKVLHRTSPEALARFERERRLLSSLGEGDGFVALLDAGESAGCPFIVMPFVSGGTLRERLARGPLALDDAVTLGRELARALGIAHARGIVHRDLKPENILQTADGRPLVADLGLGKHFHHDSPGASQSVVLSRSGEFRGTAGYMAPEQASDAAAAGPQADVFSLGAILYECLTGEHAFEGRSVLEVLEKLTAGAPVRVRAHRPEVPRWLASVVERALARDPRDRFEDGVALGRALVAPRRGSRRALAAAIVVLVAALGVVLAWQHFREPPAVAVRESAAERLERAQKLTKEALARGEAGRWKDAFVLAQTALELAPRSSTATWVRGLARENTGDRAGARADYDAALALDPRNMDALNRRGLLRFTSGDREGAVDDMTRAIELAPENAILRANRGRFLIDLGDPVRAIEDLDRSIALDPRLAVTWGNRGVARGSTGDLAGGIADLQRSLELDPRDAKTWNSLGGLRHASRDFPGTIEACTRAIELDPGVSSAWANRGAARGDSNDPEGAISDESRAIEIDPTNYTAMASRGAARIALGDLDGAIADLEQFLAHRPDDPDAPKVRDALERVRAAKRR